MLGTLGPNTFAVAIPNPPATRATPIVAPMPSVPAAKPANVAAKPAPVIAPTIALAIAVKTAI